MDDNIDKKKWSDNIDWKKWTDPVTFLVMAIIISIFVLIAWNLPGMLNNLSNRSYARGLITYLFAIGTIGAIAVTLLYALLNKEADSNHFTHAKDLLSILIGVFGTIIGFYFGTDAADTTVKQTEIKVIPIKKIDDSLALEKNYPYTTAINGGQYPYNFNISLSGKTVAEGFTDGLIETNIFLDSSFASINEQSSDLILKITDNTSKVKTITEKHVIIHPGELKK